MQPLEVWPQLADRGERLCAVRAPTVDRNYLLGQLLSWGQQRNLPLYFWNLGCTELLLVASGGDRALLVEPSQLCPPVELAGDTDRFAGVLRYLAQVEATGIFVIEGLLEHLTLPLQHQLETLYFQLGQALGQAQTAKFLIFVGEGEQVEVPLALHPMLPQLEFPLPSRTEVLEQVSQFFWERFDQEQSPENLDWQRPIAQACVGLPRAEIEIVLNRMAANENSESSEEAIASRIIDYKQKKLAGRGVTLLPEPDVPTAAGMDLLDETLEAIRLLMTPEAEERGLKPPKAMLLWGIPGTGKSLAAKLAAKRIGGTLVAADWNGLLGRDARESLGNLEYLLKFVEQIGPSVLFFDEFDKAFGGGDNSGDRSGSTGKLTARLLSWMNDHEEPCVMVAAINHLGMLPPEMIRRFEVIHFFGMPHNGALHAVFEIHLSKYFEYEFAINEWHYLLREYRGCTPAEIMKAVKAVAARRFFRDMQAGVRLEPGQKPEISLAELIEERQNFIPDASKREISDAIAGILNQADYAKPVQGEDKSPFAEPPQRLLGIDEEAIREQIASLNGNGSSASRRQQPLITRKPPIVEEI